MKLHGVGQPKYLQNCADVGGYSRLIDLNGLAVDHLATGPQCEDGNQCTDDLCINASVCSHPLKAQCLTPTLELLTNDEEP